MATPNLYSVDTITPKTTMGALGDTARTTMVDVTAEYAAKIDTILIDINLTGGQVSTTHQVSNYPGFIDAQPGYMISHYMSEQARGAGAKYKVAVDLTSVDLEKKEIVIDENEKIIAKKIIVATGSSPRALGIPGETEYKGNGISYCATCDAKYFDGKHAIVVGGGNSAIEEALFITKFAKKLQLYTNLMNYKQIRLHSKKYLIMKK